ncbi:saccharopine dehydrogenase family protein [Paenibacillus sp. LPE1-1-1.1]|uniref:saccharopine dehydrogenase family protein n=1 Tax=Paenibacillus sp. LPE1-1-1.1 TaxID=3135230 RepID=UPI0034288CB0
MKTDIIVVGGYGHVGGQICKLLSASYFGSVYAAGRSLERAEAFCSRMGGGVKPLVIDVEKPVSREHLERVKLVIMCLDQTAADFAEACLKAGADYVDVSANGRFFEAMEQVKQRKEEVDGTALLSVGLAPGLTNLLVLKAMQALEEVTRADIGIMLGLGDTHGKAAIEWTVNSLGATFDITEEGRTRKADSFTEGVKTDFGDGWGTRTAYRFPFSDQQTLPKTLGMPTISTRLCFDSRIATVLIAWLRKAGFVRFMSFSPIKKLMIHSLGKLRFGSEGFAVKVTGYGKLAGAAAMAEFGLQGEKEADITAAVAAAAAKLMYENKLPKGIFHIEQLFELDLMDHGITLRLTHYEGTGCHAVIPSIQSWSRMQS